MALCCFIIVKFGWVTKRIFQVCFWNLSQVSLWMRTGCPMACSQGVVHAGRDIIKDCLQPGLKDTYQVLFWLMRTSEDEMAGWMDHLLDGPMRWTWTWANSGRQWGTGRPGVLQSPSTLSVTVLFLTTLLSSMFTMGKQVELLQSMMYCPKRWFKFFLKTLWENPNKLFGQPNVILLAVSLFLTVHAPCLCNSWVWLMKCIACIIFPW